MMRRFPDWLSDRIAARATELRDKSGLDEESAARLTRLCCDPEMEGVWRTLDRAALGDDSALLDFFEFVRLEAAFAGQPDSISPMQLRQSFKRIADLGGSLMKELHRLGPAPVEELRAALRRTPRAPAQTKRATTAEAQRITVFAFELHDQLTEDSDSAGLMESLKTLTQAALLAAQAPPPPGPHKRGAKNAARTDYIQTVDRFVLERFGRRMHTVVATTVNVIFAWNNPVSADLVRNLSRSNPAPENRKISVKSRR